MIGGVVAGAGDGEVRLLGNYGERIGLAFQIADDILDVTSTSEQLGKTPGKDQKSRKATYPAIHGMEASLKRARELSEEAVEIIGGIKGDTTVLRQLAVFIISRES
jgi:geranylgeranyl diphosphate synthase type II